MAGYDRGSYDLSMFDTVFNGYKQDPMGDQGAGSASPKDEERPMLLLNAREAAVYLRVSLSTLHRMERCGRLRALRTPGGHRRYTLAMLNHCLESQDLQMDGGQTAGGPVPKNE